MLLLFQILRALGSTYFLYVEFIDFYVNQSLAGQTVHLISVIQINFTIQIRKSCRVWLPR
jgi:hypothetical protein